MIGAAAIDHWRLDRLPIRSVDINVTERKPSPAEVIYAFEPGRRGWSAEVWVQPEEPIEALDVRFCKGLFVFIHADEERHGIRMLQQVLGADPRMACLIAPGKLVRIKRGEAAEWAL